MLGVIVEVCVEFGNVPVPVFVAGKVELGVVELGLVPVAVWAIFEGNAWVGVAGVDVSVGVAVGKSVEVGEPMLVGDEGFAGLYVGLLVAGGGIEAVWVGHVIGRLVGIGVTV